MRYALIAMWLCACTARNAALVSVQPDDLAAPVSIFDLAQTDQSAPADLTTINGRDLADPPVSDLTMPIADMTQTRDLAQPNDMTMCLTLGAPCDPATSAVCCGGQGTCGFTGVGPPVNQGGPSDNCCRSVGSACSTNADCCSPYACKLISGSLQCNP